MPVRRLGLSIAAVCLLAAGCAKHGPPATTSIPPSTAPESGKAAGLEVSVGEGSAGAHVVLTVRGCPARHGNKDEIVWQDSAQVFGAPGHREVADVQRIGDELHATFVVLASDPLGQGLLEARCGGDMDHTSAAFTVVAP